MVDATAKQADEAGRAGKRGRSPAYPAITLKAAIDKARALYNVEGKYPVPMQSAFKAWGYGAKSSGGRDTRAALKYFGLIAIDGDNKTGKAKLTDDALRILLDVREDQTEKKAIIRRLALAPAIHKKLFEKFPEGIKSDATAVHYLVFDESYNPVAASELIAEYKATAAYAELFQPDSMLVKDPLAEGLADRLGGDSDEPEEEPPAKPLQPKGQFKMAPGERELVTGLLSKDASFRLVVSGTVGVKEIDRLIAKLQLDKEILADEEASEGDE